MRTSIAILSVLWIIGIACGVFSISFVIVGLIGMFCIALLYRSDFSAQRCSAALAVLVLGVLLGHSRADVPIPMCDTAAPIQATLTEIRGMYATHTLSVFKKDDGCSILVYAPQGLVLIEGASVIIDGKVERVADVFKRLPGYVKFLQEDGISLIIRNPHVSVITQGTSLVSRARLSAMGAFGSVFGEPDAGVLIAMMIGDRGMIPREVTDTFQKSGITHILSISGFHVSLLAGVLALVFLRLPIPSWAYYVFVGGILWTYIIAIGAPPAAIRAGMFWTFVIVAYRMHALVGLPTIVLLTLCALLSFDPSLVRSIGFQLSIAAVIGLGVGVFFFRRFHVSSAIRPLALSIAVSLGATGATLPLTAYYFGNISLIGILVNIIAIPLVAILMYVALGALVLSFLWKPLGMALSFITHILMQALLAVARFGANIPYGSFQDISLPLWAVGAYYVCCALLFFVALRLFRIRFREIWV